jgi:hypothetical protein
LSNILRSKILVLTNLIIQVSPPLRKEGCHARPCAAEAIAEAQGHDGVVGIFKNQTISPLTVVRGTPPLVKEEK